MNKKKDYYFILQVGQKASAKKIERTYQRLVKQYQHHQARVNDINEAYETLSNSEKRSHYDQFDYAQANVFGKLGDNISNFFYKIFGSPNKKNDIIDVKDSSNQD